MRSWAAMPSACDLSGDEDLTMETSRRPRSETKRELTKRTSSASVDAGRLRTALGGALLPLMATACVAGCAVPGDSTDPSADDPSAATAADPPEDSLPETGVLHVKTMSRDRAAHVYRAKRQGYLSGGRRAR